MSFFESKEKSAKTSRIGVFILFAVGVSIAIHFGLFSFLVSQPTTVHRPIEIQYYQVQSSARALPKNPAPTARPQAPSSSQSNTNVTPLVNASDSSSAFSESTSAANDSSQPDPAVQAEKNISSQNSDSSADVNTAASSDISALPDASTQANAASNLQGQLIKVGLKIQYPQQAIDENRQGVATVQLRASENHQLQQAERISSTGHKILDDEIDRALAQWQSTNPNLESLFQVKDTTTSGKNLLTVPIRFKLN